MNEAALISELRRRVKRSSQTAVAAELGVSKQYLCDILAGRRQPGPAIVDAMGLRRLVSYQPTNGS